LKKLFISLVRGYQKFISVLFPRNCRYYPTCSQYVIQAVEIHGLGKGLLMGIFRIFRCHPFVKGGVDEVPQTFCFRRNVHDDG
jgi:putative membrane protein insertion efficiency factor